MENENWELVDMEPKYWYLLVSQFSKIFFPKAHFRLEFKVKKFLGSIMGNLSTSWLIVWFQVINKIGSALQGSLKKLIS
jgi:hypothetical protein